jgi:hypothetical protein
VSGFFKERQAMKTKARRVGKSPEDAFLHRLARACSRVRRFDAKERAIVYADSGEAEVSGGPCSEAED